MPMWNSNSNDGQTYCGRMPRARPVAPKGGGMGRMERDPRGTGKKEEERGGGRGQRSFAFYIYEFLSPTTTARAFMVNTGQADDVVPVHLVPIDLVNFVAAACSSVSVLMAFLFPYKTYVL